MSHSVISLCSQLCAWLVLSPGLSEVMAEHLSFLLFCLRLLQRWFFHQAVPGCLLMSMCPVLSVPMLCAASAASFTG
jgi:hypothetical protein